MGIKAEGVGSSATATQTGRHKHTAETSWSPSCLLCDKQVRSSLGLKRLRHICVIWHKHRRVNESNDSQAHVTAQMYTVNITASFGVSYSPNYPPETLSDRYTSNCHWHIWIFTLLFSMHYSHRRKLSHARRRSRAMPARMQTKEEQTQSRSSLQTNFHFCCSQLSEKNAAEVDLDSTNSTVTTGVLIVGLFLSCIRAILSISLGLFVPPGLMLPLCVQYMF